MAEADDGPMPTTMAAMGPTAAQPHAETLMLRGLTRMLVGGLALLAASTWGRCCGQGGTADADGGVA